MYDEHFLARWVGSVAAVLALSFLFCAVAGAQTCYEWQISNGNRYQTGAEACAFWGPAMGATLTCTPAGPPPGNTVDLSATGTFNNGGATVAPFQLGAPAVVTGSSCGANPNNPSNTCTAGNTVNLMVVNGDNVGQTTPVGGTVCGSDGCGYTAYTAHSQFVVGAGGCTAVSCKGLIMQKHQSTGTSCAASAGAPSPGPPTIPNQTNSTCGLAAGQVACAITAQNGTQSASFGGDQVTPSTMPQTGCVAFASGGSACVVPMGQTTAQTPPAPNNGTQGTTANPDGVVTTGNGSTTTTATTVEYFGPKTVSNSTTSVMANGTGTTTTAIGGAGAGSGGGASSAAGDCDSPGSEGEGGCSDGTTPDLTRTDTAASDAASMWSGIQATPLFSAFHSVSTAFASGGSCPTASVTLTTIHVTGDFMTSFCSVFASDLSTMVAISDAAWCLLGLLILVSA